jgi:hypothetical protein
LSAVTLASLNCQRHTIPVSFFLLCLEVRRSWQPGSPPMVKHASVRNWFFYASHLIISMLHMSSIMMRQCMLRSPCCLWPKPKADFYAWLEHSSMHCLEPWSWRGMRNEPFRGLWKQLLCPAARWAASGFFWY